jgi:replicative DNA helicase
LSLTNQQAEEAVIASLLVDPTQVALVAGKLTPEDFSTTVYREAFIEMERLSRLHQSIDHITLAAAGVTLPDTLDILAATRGGGIEDHIRLIKDATFRREVFAQASRIAQQADAGVASTDILAEMTKLSHAAAQGGTDNRLLSAERASDLYLQEIERRKTQGVGLSYGIPALDALLQPAHGGDMVVVAARPSIGKTALAETIVDYWAADAELPVLFVSIEMSLAQLMDRAISRRAGIPSQHITRGRMTADEEVLARETVEARRSVNIWYVDNPYATTDAVRAAAARVALERGGLAAICIDYLQLLKDPGEQEVQRITRVSRNVKALGREFECPVLVLSQLNRNSEYRAGSGGDPHPRLADIRESGAIEQDADVVLGLYRDREMESEFDDSPMDIDILKNRQGPSGVRVTIPFSGDTVSFRT